MNILTHSLRELLQIEVDFDWTGLCNEAFEKLRLCMNSDTCLSYFDDPPTIVMKYVKSKENLCDCSSRHLYKDLVKFKRINSLC